MPRRKNGHRLPPDNARSSVEELSNRTRNELQKTMLLIEHRHILNEKRATLLQQYEDLVDQGKKSVADLKKMIVKRSDDCGRKAS